MVSWKTALLTLLIVRAYGIWEREALSQQRAYLASATAGDLVLLGGGNKDSTMMSVVDVFNLTSLKWEETKSLSLARQKLSAASSGDLILFGGGSNITNRFSTVDIYDVAVGGWLAPDELSFAREELTASSLGELIFFAGGRDGTTEFETVDIFNVSSKNWLTPANLSEARYLLASAASSEGNVVLFAGGHPNSGCSDVVDIFNKTSMAWETPVTLSLARYDLAGASSGELIFFAGGGDGAESKDVIDIYNVTLSGWMPTATLSVARLSLGAVSTSLFVAFGGGVIDYTGFGVKYAEVDYFDMVEQKWILMSLTEQREQVAGVGTEIGGPEGSPLAFFAGGKSAGGDSDIVDIFSPLRSEHSRLFEPRWGLVASTATSFLEEEVVMFAGGSDQTYTATVDILNKTTLATELEFVSCARGEMGTSAINDLIFFAGGSRTGTLYDIVDVFNVSSMTWNTTSSLSQARSHSSGASVRDVVLFAGGSAGSLSDVVDIFNYTTSSWSVSSTPLSVARYDIESVSLMDEIVIFAGGTTIISKCDEVDLFNASTKTWTTGSLSEARSNFAGASYGDFGLFAGGFSTAASAVVDIYVYSINNWTSSSLSEARSFLAGASSNGLIMFAGGFGTSLSSTVDIFNTNTEVWSNAFLEESRTFVAGIGTSKAIFFAGGDKGTLKSNLIENFVTSVASQEELAEARERLTAVSSSGVILFAGGLGYFGRSRTVEIFDKSNMEWRRGFLSMRRSDLASAAIGGLFLFAGGEALDGVSDVVDFYNCTTGPSGHSGIWSVGTLSVARSHLAAASTPRGGGLVLVGGGWNGTHSSAVVDKFNLSSYSWSVSSVPLSVARYELAASSVADEIVMFAGGWNGTACVNTVDVYNASSDSWTTNALSEARRRLAGESSGDVLLFAGGYNGSAYSARIDIYSYSTNNWTISTLSEPRDALAAASTNGFVMFAGGEGVSGNSSAVEVYNARTGEWNFTSLNTSRSFLVGAGTKEDIFFAGGVEGEETFSLMIDRFNTSIWNASFALSSSSSSYSSWSSSSSSSSPSGSVSSASGSSTSTSSASSTSTPSGSGSSTSTPSGSSTSTPSGSGSSTSSTSSTSSIPSSEEDGLLKFCTDSPICLVGVFSFLFLLVLIVCIVIVIVIIVIVVAVLGTGTTVALKSRNSVNSGEKATPTDAPEDMPIETVESAELEPIEEIVDLEAERKSEMASRGRRESFRISQAKMSALVAEEEQAVVDISELKLGKMIGKGEFGKTYLAKYLGAQIIVKQSEQDLEGESPENSEFLREAATMVKLRHPNIVQFLGVTLSPLNILMEYIPDGDVESLLKKETLQLRQKVQIAKGAAAGVLYLHKFNIVHGDLAARNLLVRKDFEGSHTVKVADFGLSSMFSDIGTIGVSGKFAIAWSSPEMLTIRAVSTASDVYAFGMTLYEIFEGKKPFYKSNSSEITKKVKAGDRPMLSRAPLGISKLIEMCWAQNPEDRPDMNIVLEHLERIEEENAESSEGEDEDMYSTL